LRADGPEADKERHDYELAHPACAGREHQADDGHPEDGWYEPLAGHKVSEGYEQCQADGKADLAPGDDQARCPRAAVESH
jgi:hypothetical protein